jgi:phosphatidylserine/phosphatidylglycerophosphate/cardiolipin synthase-like enzyme
MSRKTSTLSLLCAGLILTLPGCKSRSFHHRASAASAPYQCEKGVRLIDFTGRFQSCYKLDAVERDTALSVGAERKLPPFVPCNQVTHIAETSDRQFNNSAYIDWLKTAPALQTADLDAMFANPEHQPSAFANHPLLRSPSHKAIVGMIRNAQHTIFLDVMLFGGVWGAEIIREMLLANKQRGVEIVFMRDTRNIFWFKPEIEPVWSRMITYGANHPGVAVLRSDTLHRTGDIPFLIDVFNQLGSAPRAMGGDLSGTSDHSKALIVDGFDEHAAAYITSKNFSDFNYINYDEGVVIQGPAAGMLQANFMPDLKLAIALAQKERPGNGEPALADDDLEQFERWKIAHARVMSGDGMRYPARGSTSVRILENNADNTIRTVENGVYTLIASAKKSVRIYNFLAFNPMLTKALIDAENRLGEGNVRQLLDTADSYPGNQMMLYGLQKLRNPAFRTPITELSRWRKTIPLIPKSQIPDGVDIGQEQHVKSIIVDDRYYLAGSANFDLLTIGGTFREASVIVDDPAVAQQATTIFDSIWDDPNQIITSEELARAYPKETFDEKSNRFLYEGLLDEQRRIRALNPLNIVPSDSCMK